MMPTTMATGQVTSVFLYVTDVERSVEFYQIVLGAEVRHVHPQDHAEGPITLAILRLANLAIMLHPQQPYQQHFEGARLGVGIHPQIKVSNVDAFYHRCLEQGALLNLSGEPVDQQWGWREFAVRDPDGYIWSIYEDKTDGYWE